MSGYTWSGWINLQDVIGRVLAIRTDPDGNQNIIVEQSELRNGVDPIKAVIVPIGSLQHWPASKTVQEMKQWSLFPLLYCVWT